MAAFMPDTNCMVAVILRSHDHHQRATAAIGGRLGRGETMVLAAPSIIETYSVLTRLPRSLRLQGSIAAQAIQHGFLDRSETTALDGEAYKATVADCALRGVVGGAVYDAVIAACALTARVDVLLTFNERHFAGLRSSGIDVLVP